MSYLTLVPKHKIKDYHYEAESFDDAYCVYRFHIKKVSDKTICVREVAFTLLSDTLQNPLKIVMKIKPKKFFYNTFVAYQPQPKLDLTLNMSLLIDNCCTDDVIVINDERLDEYGNAEIIGEEWLKNSGVLVYAPENWFKKFLISFIVP